MELIQWKELSKDYEKELKSGSLATDVFSENTEKGNKRWADLKNRVAEHVCIAICYFYIALIVIISLCLITHIIIYISTFILFYRTFV